MTFSNLGDKLKLVTPALGMISIPLISFDGLFNTYAYKKSGMEEYFFAICIIALIVSYAVLALTALGANKSVSQWKIIDAGLHGIIGALLLIGAIVYIVAIMDTDHKLKDLKVDELQKRLARRASALTFELINSFLYFGIAFLSFKS